MDHARPSATRPPTAVLIAALVVVAVTALLLGCGLSTESNEPAEPADRILLGTVLTMNDETPRAEAVAIRAGLVQAVGTRDEVLALSGSETRVDDLGEQAILPGFVDAHGHLALVATFEALVDLASPPVGPVQKLDDLVTALQARAAETADSPAWIVGAGYDDSLLAENRHPTRDELDRVSTERAVVAVHVSGHLLAANTRALELAGVTARSDDPPGGIIRRRTGSSEPDGVLEETAMGMVLAKLPQPDLEQRLELLGRAQDSYLSRGITLAQEGGANTPEVDLLRAAQERGLLELDVVAYVRTGEAEKVYAEDGPSRTDDGRLRFGGVKMTLDGSPQGKTAYLTEPYHVPPESESPDYRGYPTLPDERVNELVADYARRGWHLLAHANGDAAADQLLAAVAQASEALPGRDHRTVMIHAQAIRPDQVESMSELGVLPSFFVAHTFYWGDWHRDSVLGPERAAVISPAQHAGELGIRYSFHNDAPVVPPDVLRLIWAGSERRTRSDQVLGPEQRVSVEEALRAVTLDAAYQVFEEERRGSIEVGKLADFAVLSADPVASAGDPLLGIEVTKTIKQGVTVYEATSSPPSASP